MWLMLNDFAHCHWCSNASGWTHYRWEIAARRRACGRLQHDLRKHTYVMTTYPIKVWIPYMSQFNEIVLECMSRDVYWVLRWPVGYREHGTPQHASVQMYCGEQHPSDHMLSAVAGQVTATTTLHIRVDVGHLFVQIYHSGICRVLLTGVLRRICRDC